MIMKLLGLSAIILLSLSALAQDSPAKSDPSTGQKNQNESDTAIQLGQPVQVVDPVIGNELREKDVASVLSGTMTDDGTFKDVTLAGGDTKLGNAAIRAIPGWRYTASTENGKPVDLKVFIIIQCKRGKFSTSLEPDLPFPTSPRTPIKDLVSKGELFIIVKPGLVEYPKETYTPEPEYSEAGRILSYRATAVFGMIIGRDGTASDIWVATKAGLGLDQKGIQTLRKWKFQPATKEGKPVPVLVNIEVVFHPTDVS